MNIVSACLLFASCSVLHAVHVLDGGGSSFPQTTCVTNPDTTTMPSATTGAQTVIAAQCCESFTGACRRYVGTNDDSGCISGEPPRVHTHKQAVTLCSDLGLQLCDQNCAGQGCHYNEHPVWTSMCNCVEPLDGPYDTVAIAADFGCQCADTDQVIKRPPGASRNAQDSNLRPCYSTWDAAAARTALACKSCFDLGSGVWDTQGDGKSALKANIEQCLGPSCTNQSTMFLIGDSHCVNFHSALRIALQGRMTVVALSSPLCGYRPVELNPLVPQQRCNDYMSALHDVLREKVKPGDVIAVAAFVDTFANPTQLRDLAAAHRQRFPDDPQTWLMDAVDGDMPDCELSALGTNKFISQLRTLNELLVPRGAAMLLLGDMPALVPGDCLNLQWDLTCIGSGMRTSQGCPRPWPSPDRFWEEATRQAYSTFSETRPSVFHFDGSDLLCDEGICSGYIPGTDFVAYIDADHLSDAGSAYLWPFVCSYLNDNMRPLSAMSSGSRYVGTQSLTQAPTAAGYVNGGGYVGTQAPTAAGYVSHVGTHAPTAADSSCRKCNYISRHSRQALFASLPCCTSGG